MFRQRKKRLTSLGLFGAFPLELLSEVFSYLCVGHLGRLMQLNSTFNTFVKCDVVWQRRCLREFPDAELASSRDANWCACMRRLHKYVAFHRFFFRLLDSVYDYNKRRTSLDRLQGLVPTPQPHEGFAGEFGHYGIGMVSLYREYCGCHRDELEVTLDGPLLFRDGCMLRYMAAPHPQYGYQITPDTVLRVFDCDEGLRWMTGQWFDGSYFAFQSWNECWGCNSFNDHVLYFAPNVPDVYNALYLRTREGQHEFLRLTGQSVLFMTPPRSRSPSPMSPPLPGAADRTPPRANRWQRCWACSSPQQCRLHHWNSSGVSVSRSPSPSSSHSGSRSPSHTERPACSRSRSRRLPFSNRNIGRDRPPFSRSISRSRLSPAPHRGRRDHDRGRSREHGLAHSRR